MKSWKSKIEGTRVSQTKILEARELRANRQRELVNMFGKTLICFTLNIVGPIKNFSLANATFAEGAWMVETHLNCTGVEIIHSEYRKGHEGPEGYISVDADPFKIKDVMMEIEESCEFSRLFDLDVISPSGEIISRNSLKSEPRRCLLCSNTAFDCATSGTHSFKKVIKQTIEVMVSYFRRQKAIWISSLAIKSLLYELSVSSKPGLVDRFNNGAHMDMNYYTFINSISKLQSVYYQIAMVGLISESTPQDLMKGIRFWGRKAEIAMMEATGGVNTHKGAIYLLGIIVAAAGRQLKEEIELTAGGIGNLGAEMAKDVIKMDFQQAGSGGSMTRGIEQYLKYGLTGIRGEVAGCFKTVQNYGLPALRRGLEAGLDINDAGLYALLILIAVVKDSNIIGRSGIETQIEVQKFVNEKLQRLSLDGSSVANMAKEIDDWFISRNISPGGSADLLSVTFMFYFLETEQGDLIARRGEYLKEIL